MKKEGSTALEKQDSTGKANFAAFPLIAAFALPDLFVFPKVLIFALIPLVVLEIIVIGYYSSKVKNKEKLAKLALQEASGAPKPIATIVGKGEVVGDNLQFSVAKGMRKKHWIVVKSIPVSEVSKIESAENELTVTWNGVTAAFATQEKAGSFRELRDQVQGIQDFQRKIVEEQERANIRKSDLTGVMNASIPIIDLSFNILVGLQEKRVNWIRLDGYASSLGENLSFPAQKIPSLNLDFSKVNLAIKNMGAKETSKEAYEILKSIDGYFGSLKFNDGVEGALPKCKDAKNIIVAYYVLNDLLLGKVVGDRENSKENAYLETLLQNLSKQTNFNVNFKNLKETMDSEDFEADRESVIEDSREIFKEQLKTIDLLSEHYSTDLPPTKQPLVAEPEVMPPLEPQELPQPELAQPPIQQLTVEQYEKIMGKPAVQPESTEPPKPQEPNQPQPTPTAIEPPAPVQPPEPQSATLSSGQQLTMEQYQKMMGKPAIPQHALTEPPKPQEPIQSPESPAIDQQEQAQPPTEQYETSPSAIEEPESAQAETLPGKVPETETSTEPHELAPKKKGFGRRLRKSLMGY